MWLIRSIVILVGVIAFLWLGTSNADQRVDFSFFNQHYPGLGLNMLMLVVFAAGMLFSFLILVPSEFHLRHTIGRQQKDIVRLERELAALRNLPLDEGEVERTEA
ncbi:MAG: LapA family protein [Candidatus Latescibacterota bacterium]|nr:MAG: LapA family protein [Candidatus Latescibacterota bacterium]